MNAPLHLFYIPLSMVRQSSPSGAVRAEAYFKAEFQVPAHLADEAAGILAAFGALGCAAKWSRRLHRHPSGTVALEAYFRNLPARALSRIERRLAAAGMLNQAAQANPPQRVIDPGWAAMWKDRFKPIAIGSRLLILPPWANVSDLSRLRIVIEPGQGFGTGYHPTTRGTLLALEKECARRPIRRALDVGTGSGILAIAMVLLGVKSVAAVDTDRQALDNARHNLALNHLGTSIRLRTTMPRSGSYDLIAANILSSVLIEMAPQLIARLSADATVILSGILEREAREVLRNYRPALRPAWSHTERGWSTLVLRRSAGGAARR